MKEYYAIIGYPKDGSEVALRLWPDSFKVAEDLDKACIICRHLGTLEPKWEWKVFKVRIDPKAAPNYVIWDLIYPKGLPVGAGI